MAVVGVLNPAMLITPGFALVIDTPVTVINCPTTAGVPPVAPPLVVTLPTTGAPNSAGTKTLTEVNVVLSSRGVTLTDTP